MNTTLVDMATTSSSVPEGASAAGDVNPADYTTSTTTEGMGRSHPLVQMETINRAHFNGYSHVGPVADPNSTTIELDFRLRQNNMDKVKQIVDDTSNPKSANYGKHLTKDQLNELTQNKEGQQLLHEFLRSVGANIVKETPSGIHATATALQWNAALNADFHLYRHESNGNELMRTEAYSLPEELSKEVTSVFGTVQFPPPIHGGPKRIEPKRFGLHN